MPSGKMLRWNKEKGFGFIQPEDGGDDVFCHVTGLKDGEGSVHEGDTVKFKVSYDDRKGKDRAVDVVRSGGGGGRYRSRSREGRHGGGSKRGRSEDDAPRSKGGRDDDRRGGRNDDRRGGRDDDRGRRRRDRSDSRRR
mmetsp:Transcript_39400/g.104478  ORF Transcript_39400/g.104478 Transcript_39400/m.104478 type:complete len:138 (-) Transcript_39400:293-706(-)